ncbi:MAG: GNAT family N-acetyltransferase [Haloechinothrix sp.]
MSEISVRIARPNEIERAGEIVAEAYLADGLLANAGDYEDHLRDAGDRAANAELLVAVDSDGTVLGSVTVAPHGTKYAEVARQGELEFRMLATAVAAQGRGVGELLTRAVLGRARELGCQRVVLCLMESNVRAQRLYGRLGFTRLPERDWRPHPGLRLLAFGVEL